MAASLDDLFSSAKNLVTGINNLGQVYAYAQGIRTSPSIPAATTATVSSSAGRLTGISVTTAGTTEGTIWDSTRQTPIANTIIAAIPNVIGFYPVGIPFITGLVVQTGTGQVVTLIYS